MANTNGTEKNISWAYKDDSSLDNVPVETYHQTVPSSNIGVLNADIIFNQKGLSTLIYHIKDSFRNNYKITSSLTLLYNKKMNRELTEDEKVISNKIEKNLSSSNEDAIQYGYLLNDIKNNSLVSFQIGDTIRFIRNPPQTNKVGRLWYEKNYTTRSSALISGFDENENFKGPKSNFEIKSLTVGNLTVTNNFNANMDKILVTGTAEAVRKRLEVNYIDITDRFNYTGVSAEKVEVFVRDTVILQNEWVTVGIIHESCTRLNDKDWVLSYPDPDKPDEVEFTFSSLTKDQKTRVPSQVYFGSKTFEGDKKVYKILTGEELANFLETKIKFKSNKYQIDIDENGTAETVDIYYYDENKLVYSIVDITKSYPDFSNKKSGYLFVKRLNTNEDGDKPYYFGDNKPIGNPGIGLFDYAYVNGKKQRYGDFTNIEKFNSQTKERTQMGWEDLLEGSITTPGGIAAGKSIMGYKLHGAIFNDYAEFRATNNIEPGRCVVETGYGDLKISTQRLQLGANIVSDTYGFSIGQTSITNTPIAVCGRVLAYPYEDRETYTPGAAVCSGPNGTISLMTRDEIKEWPDAIIGYVSEIPYYEKWGSDKVEVNGRIWIKVI